jgi:F0F1-type ATP synthase assembly protein I
MFDPEDHINQTKLVIGCSFISGVFVGAAVAGFLLSGEAWTLTPLGAAGVIMVVVWMETSS